MSLNNFVSNAGHTLSSAFTKQCDPRKWWNEDTEEAPERPQDALPVEKFKDILPPSADTNGDGCIGLDEYDQEIASMQAKAFSWLAHHYYDCQPFDLRTALIFTESAFYETGIATTMQKANVVFIDNSIIPQFVDNWVNFSSSVHSVKLILTKIAPTGGAEVGVTVDNQTGETVSIRKGSPAERAGIRAGDVITAINGFLYQDLPSPTPLEIIGPCGTKVDLMIYRPSSFLGLDIFQLGLMLDPENVQKNFGYKELSLTREAARS